MSDDWLRFRVAPDGHVADASADVASLLGVDPDGMQVEDLFVEEGIIPAGPICHIAAETGPLPVRVRVDGIGEDGIAISLQDASDLAEEMERVRRSEAQLREAQQLALIGSWSWDIVGDRIDWSDELYELYGLKPQGTPATFEAYIERIHLDDRDLANEVVQKAFADHGPFSFDHRVIRADNSETRWLHGQGAVVVKDGQPIRMYGISQDVTLARRARELEDEALRKDLELDHLRRLNRARSDMVHAMAHELGNPLTPMRLQANLLTHERLGKLTQKQNRALSVLEQNIARLSLLVSDFLDAARLESGHLRLELGDLDIVAVANQAIEGFAPQAAERGITVELQAPDTLAAMLDEQRLAQVMYNLVSNAIKFSREKGNVTVGLGADDDEVTIRVQDDGVGLDADEMAEVFKPFVRHRNDIPGNGLGLHICRSIVETHGGTLTCESDGADQGATFTARLPRYPTEEAAEAVAVKQ